MNAYQPCRDISDSVELFPPQGLYLKPIARLNISVQLPLTKNCGKTISNWEVMDKLRNLIKPEEFTVLKVSKSTLEFIRFEGEIESKSKLPFVVGRLEGSTFKLNGFSELLKVRAAEAKISFPTRHNWDSYFRDARNMNEMKPGERPDTIHISNLPCKWFAAKQDVNKGNDKPNEYIFRKVFEVFGDVRCVDIPAADPYRSKMKANISGIQVFSFGQELCFEAYVQYKEYICFVKAMDALRGMKLLYKDGDCAFTASIKVDFDKTKHLSEPSIRRRRIEREKLMALEREQEEKERIEQELAELHQEEERKLREEEKRLKLERRRQREEKRRQQLILKMREKETEEVNRKIALEERKLLIAQRKLESIRLLGELFERLKNVVPEQVIINKEETVTEGAVTVVQDKELQEEGATENINPLDREKELRRRLMERFKSLHKQQSERLQMTREGKDVSSIQVVRSDFTSSDSELSSSSSNSEISLSHSSSSTEPHHGSQSSETKSGSKWKEERHSDEDKSKHYFEKRYNYPASGRNDHSYPRYSSYHYNNSHFRPFRGRRYNQSRQGVFPYRQRFRHAKGEGSYYHSLPDNAHDMHHYYEDIHQEYYKYFQKLAKQDESKDKDFTSCSQESSSCTNSRSGSQSSSKSNRTSSRLSFPSKSKYSPVNLSKSNSEESIRESHKSHPLKRKQVRSDTKTRSLTSRSRSLSLSSSNSNVQKDDSNGELVTDARSKQKRNVAKRTKNKKHHKKHKKHKHKSKH